jgi:hypothetical protein
MLCGIVKPKESMRIDLKEMPVDEMKNSFIKHW